MASRSYHGIVEKIVQKSSFSSLFTPQKDAVLLVFPKKPTRTPFYKKLSLSFYKQKDAFTLRASNPAICLIKNRGILVIARENASQTLLRKHVSEGANYKIALEYALLLFFFKGEVQGFHRCCFWAAFDVADFACVAWHCVSAPHGAVCQCHY